YQGMGKILSTQVVCPRQHTTAFVPSSGRIYSFGLGGNGQLGTGTTSNRKSPFTVKGNWLPYSTQCPITTDSEECYCVKRIFSGGDQSFAHYFYPQTMVPPDDFRYPDFSKQIWTVNETFIQRLLTFPSGRLPVEIANEIDGTFSSAGCLNGSFLALSNDDHYKTSTRFSGVDMNAARLLFHKLIQPDHAHISQQVAASLEKNLIPKLTSSLPDVEALRLYLTLPECPLMSDANNFTTLAIPFGTAILNLEKAPLKVLENWWSVLEPPLFLKIVELYKDVVVHLLKLCKIGIPASERRILTNFLHTAFRVLEILHRVNERGQIIQYDRFYIHEIQDLIDIRNDYVSWVQQQVFGM
ncbi:probable E3 ubiquitin-protein ligase HERC4, partial [Antrostomus carolinensis]|uniref:probable E3 ubiquitin-protein ligase HERC4 n=1 Tax=Antrostomus carolinensis TaxID=279965 RepID=UPI000528469F